MIVQGKSTFKCDQCVVETTSTDSMARHKKEKHAEEPTLRCAPDCEYTYTISRMSNFMRHRNSQGACTR